MEYYERSRRGLTDSPIVSIALIVINVIVFLVLSKLGDTENAAFMIDHGAANWELIFKSGQYYRLFTAMFLHFGAEHLITNMFMLGVIGGNIEKNMGHLRYLAIYIVSGLVGSVCSALFYMASNEAAVSAGASGAIFGVLGALIAALIKNRKNMGRGIGGRIVLVVFLLIFGSVSSDGIDFIAHIGGFISGLIMGLILYNPRGIYRNIR